MYSTLVLPAGLQLAATVLLAVAPVRLHQLSGFNMCIHVN
jgi:hypothetical protein